MKKEQAHTFLIGLVIGALVVGGIVFVVMNQRVQKEKNRADVIEKVLEGAIEQIPKPAFPPKQ